MSNIYFGRGAAIGIGQEGTWGTAVARSNWRPLISSSLARTIEKVPRPSLRVGTLGAMQRAHFVQADASGGGVVIECTYENVGMHVKHLLGAVSTASTTHTYTIANDVPTGLTMELVRGTGSSEIFEGCRFPSGTFSVSSGGVMQLELEVIAETSTESGAESPSVAPRSAAGTPSFGSGDTPVLHSHAGTLSFNSVNYSLVDFSVTLNNALARRQLLGSAVTKQPLRSDFMSVEASLTLEVEDVLYKALSDDTESDAVITFTSGSRTFAFTIQNAFLSSATDPVSSAGIVSQSLTLVGQSDGTDEGLKVVINSGDVNPTNN